MISQAYPKHIQSIAVIYANEGKEPNSEEASINKYT